MNATKSLQIGSILIASIGKIKCHGDDKAFAPKTSSLDVSPKRSLENKIK